MLIINQMEEIESKIEAIKILLDALLDDERKELFDNYCLGCGSKDKNCQCWNDE
jgi:hypothetical protein